MDSGADPGVRGMSGISVAGAPFKAEAPSFARIATLESLREHLQWAIELEHFTLPPYLCALYSLDAVRNPEASKAVASVLVEEMLHMTLAANLLNAVGGRPQLDTPQMLSVYPRCLPHGVCLPPGDRWFEVPLLPFGPEALDVFLKIEQPVAPGGLPESDGYETIGQFYDAIRGGLLDLWVDLGAPRVFCGDPARQISDAPFPGGGRIFAINNLSTALAALDEIVEQGEGAKHVEVWDGDHDDMHPDREQVAHYYRFQELKLGRRYRRGDTPRSGPTGDTISIDWNGVRPMRRNPRSSDHAPGSAIRRAQEQFNDSYCAILRLLDQAFNGSPQMLGTAIGSMHRLKVQAQALMEMPTEDGITTAGPTFEYIPPSSHPLQRR
jgi:hypothetical protein